VTPALAVGIDVGATKLAAAVVDLDAGRLAGPSARQASSMRDRSRGRVTSIAWSPSGVPGILM